MAAWLFGNLQQFRLPDIEKLTRLKHLQPDADQHMNPFFTQPRTEDSEAFNSFYDMYAPKLWGIILSANLPSSQSETVLVNTLLKAWQHPDRQAIPEKRSFTWLLGLACAEGLPTKKLNSFLK